MLIFFSFLLFSHKASVLTTHSVLHLALLPNKTSRTSLSVFTTARHPAVWMRCGLWNRPRLKDVHLARNILLKFVYLTHLKIILPNSLKKSNEIFQKVDYSLGRKLILLIFTRNQLLSFSLLFLMLFYLIHFLSLLFPFPTSFWFIVLSFLIS